MRSPMLRAVLPFIGGCVIGHWARVPIAWLWGASITTLLIWLFASFKQGGYVRRWQRGSAFMLFLLCFGLLWWRIHDPYERPDGIARWRQQAQGWRCTVHEVIASNGRTTRLWADVNAAVIDDHAQHATGRLLLTLLHDSTHTTLTAGNELLVMAHVDSLDRTPDPGGFDVRSWAAGYGAAHTCFASTDRWRVLARGAHWTSAFQSARSQVSQWLEGSGLPDRERGMAKAILLGVRDELDQDQKDAFARSGTIHVLAVSGSHVGLIYALFVWALAFLGKRTRALLLRGVLVLIALWAYAGLTGFTPSVLRATITFSFFTLAEMTRWRTEPVNSLAGSAFMLLLWDPLALDQLSFQLSFLAVLGIAIFYRPLMNAWAPPNLVARYFWSLVAVSLSAQVFTTPLALLTFKAFPIWFLPANMVIVGLVAIGVYGGALLLLVHWIPWVGAAVTWSMKQLLLFLGWSSEFFAQLPGAYPAARINVAQCLLLYVLVLLISAWYFERWRWARMGSLIVLLALVSSWAWNGHARNAEHRFVVYDDREKVACAIVEGRSLTVICDTMDEWLAQKVERHQRSCGADSVRVLPGDPGSIRFGDHRVMFVDLHRPLPELPPHPDLVVLHGEGRVDMEALHRMQPTWGYVLAATTSHKTRSYIRTWCEKNHVFVHDVRKQGAYVR